MFTTAVCNGLMRRAGVLCYATMQPGAAAVDQVLAAVDAATSEIVEFTADLVRMPTINPPGDAYGECARFLGARLEQFAFDVSYVPAEGLAEHTATHPRINVVGRRAGRSRRPAVHLNG